MKTLVTGGSGYLGTHIRKYFDADDLSRRAGHDILNAEDARIVEEYDLVIHLAACLDKSPESADEVFLTNVEGSINLLRNVKPGTIFIFASTKDVYGRFADNFPLVTEDCPTMYSGQSALEWSKLIAERYVEYYAHLHGFRSCIFRSSTIYAPLSEGNTAGFVGHFADAINKGEPIRLPGMGRPQRDIMHVDDFASACKAFADSALQHGLYNLGGGSENALTLRDLLSKLEEVSGLQAVVDEQNPQPDPVPFNYVSSIERITHELSWRPTIDLSDGLKTLF